MAYALRTTIDVSYLIAFAAGNFVYIAATDLVPEVNRHPSLLTNFLHTACFLAGVGAMYAATGLD